jgi:hypothetical protein
MASKPIINWTTILTALIGAVVTIAVAVIGKLDWSSGNLIPKSGACRQVTTQQVKVLKDALVGIRESIGPDCNLDRKNCQIHLSDANHASITRAIDNANNAFSKIEEAC